MKILIFPILLISVVVARPTEDAFGNKKQESDGAVNENKNLKHFKRPIYYQNSLYRMCPGYQVYGPFGPGVIFNQGQGSGGNGLGSELSTTTAVGQIIGINNGYVFGSSPKPNCKGPSSNCNEGYPLIPIEPGIVLNPGQVYGNGMDPPANMQGNKPGSGGSSETNQGNSGSDSWNSGNNSGYVNGGTGLVTGNGGTAFGSGNVGITPGLGITGGGTGTPIPVSGGGSSGGQGTGSYCKRCPGNQQTTKSNNLDPLKATNDTGLLDDEITTISTVDDSEMRTHSEKAVHLRLDVDTKD